MKKFLSESGQCHIAVLSGEDVSSMLLSPDSRLPRNEISQKGSSDQLSAGSSHSNSLFDSSERLSPRIPEVSTFSTIWGRRATCHHEDLDSIPGLRSQGVFIFDGFHKMVAS